MKAKTRIEYYIAIGDIKVYCPESKTDKNTIITWFQNNRENLEKEYGAGLVSKAKLMEETVEVSIREECNLNSVKFILSCINPSTKWGYYITTSSNGIPFITASFDDMLKGKLIFKTEFEANVWLQKNKPSLSTLYKKSVIDSIKIERMIS